MVKKFVIERGSKGPEDRVIRVWSYGDILTIEDILFWLDVTFRAEDSCYPKPKNQGSCMLMKAILEIYSRFPIEDILERYGLRRKTKKTIIIDKTVSEASSEKIITKLHEVLE